jgi:cytochrome c-type biogenesis protein
MTDQLNLFLVFGAGLASVLSPCVLPVLPIIVTGTGNDNRWRPLLIVAGLAVTFMAMGVLSSLFGAVIGPAMLYVEKVAAVLIVVFGLLLIFNVNLFKHLGFLSSFAQKSRGSFGGFFLGFTLGIIWIPCVGPMLSSVLAMVATRGEITSGIFYLLVYSAGFAVPMLIAGYATQFFRKRIGGAVGKHQRFISLGSGLLLVALGGFILAKGMVGFGAF